MSIPHSFCTLFDSNYLVHGLSLYNSLIKTEGEFVLYVFCFDDMTYRVLDKMKLKNMVLVSQKEFETKKLLKLKKERSKSEYCWTCTPYILRYVLKNFKCAEVTYLDADIFFFKSPSVLLSEFHKSNSSVLITKHNYSKKYSSYAETSGIYCVQFITFKNTYEGLKVLRWWLSRCYECCSEVYIDGKFGDQKYLDNWPETFDGIHVLQHIGGGAAPWNIRQYKITSGPQIDNTDVIFYHFHMYRKSKKNDFEMQVKNYLIPMPAKKIIYTPYKEDLIKNALISGDIINQIIIQEMFKMNFKLIFEYYWPVIKKTIGSFYETLMSISSVIKRVIQ